MQLLLILYTFATAQTTIPLSQINSSAVKPPIVWSSGLAGQPINIQQMALPAITVKQTNQYTLSVPELGCTFTIQPATTIIQLGYYRGVFGVLAGHRTGGPNNTLIYIPTSTLVQITGPCVAFDTPDGIYPVGVNSLIYFGTSGMTSATNAITGVLVNFAPRVYSVTHAGLESVEGFSGQIVRYQR